jgi:hypothetical protein
MNTSSRFHVSFKNVEEETEHKNESLDSYSKNLSISKK